MIGWGFIFGSQVSAIGYLVQVFRFRFRVIHFLSANRYPLTANTSCIPHVPLPPCPLAP